MDSVKKNLKKHIENIRYINLKNSRLIVSHMSSSTTYYATFQVSSGDRMEFNIRDTEYGMLAEDDVGRLTFQGTRYMGFERSKSMEAAQ